MFVTAAISATARARSKILGLRSMPVTWPSGMSLAKLTEMVPEPEPTSKSVKRDLDSFIGCKFGQQVGSAVFGGKQLVEDRLSRRMAWLLAGSLLLLHYYCWWTELKKGLTSKQTQEILITWTCNHSNLKPQSPGEGSGSTIILVRYLS